MPGKASLYSKCQIHFRSAATKCNQHGIRRWSRWKTPAAKNKDSDLAQRLPTDLGSLENLAVAPSWMRLRLGAQPVAFIGSTRAQGTSRVLKGPGTRKLG